MKHLSRYPIIVAAVFLGFCGVGSQEAAAQEIVAPTGDMKIPRGGHTATLLEDGRVLIAGGFDTNTRTQVNSAEIYDPDTGTFELTGPMRERRWGHNAILLDDGRVLIVGGNISSFIGKTAGAEIYDPSTGTFSSTGSMSTPRAPKIRVNKLSDGRVVVTGGAFEGSFGTSTPNIDIFVPDPGNPSAEGFTKVAEMVHARKGMGNCVFDDDVLMVGGGFSCCNTTNNNLTRNSAELFDSDTNTTTLTVSPNLDQILANSVQINANQCFIFNQDGNAEIYDHSNESFEIVLQNGELSTGDLPIAIEYLDGEILISSRRGVLAYEPNSDNLRTIADDSIFKRSNHQATLLQDGRVLLTGGFDLLTNGSVATRSALLVGSEGPTDAERMLSFCLDNAEKCAFSVDHLTEGWERHWNADRPQVTASVFKLLTLIAYAEAVVDDTIDPESQVTRDEWAAAWIGRDGDNLLAAWRRLSEPASLSVDQLVGAMMRNSDNAAPDWLLSKPPVQRRLESVVRRYARGYHDVPRSINAIFTTWDGNPNEPDIGQRILNDYSGLEVSGYQDEADAVFNDLLNGGLAQAARNFTCVRKPWEPPFDSSCIAGFQTSTKDQNKLIDRYFMRSTTRTYTGLMKKLLSGRGVKSDVVEIIRPHLEFRLEPTFSDSNFADKFTRHAGKDGRFLSDTDNPVSADPEELLTWTTYLEAKNTGAQAAVTIFLRGLTANQFTHKDLETFAEAIVLDRKFSLKMQDLVPEDVAMPELIPGIAKLDLRRNQLVAAVTNGGTAIADGPIEVSLFVSNDNKLDPGDQVIALRRFNKLQPGQTRLLPLTYKGGGIVPGKFAILSIDSAEAIAESVENNNIAWQIIR